MSEPTISESKPIIDDRIYIGNVDFKATEDELKQFFEGLNVVEVELPSKTLKLGNKTVEKHLGFAFIQFKEKSDADEAIEKFNGKEFKDRKIYVKKAVPPPTEEEKQKKNELFKAKKAEQAEKAKARAKAKKAAKKAKPATASLDAETKETEGETETKEAKSEDSKSETKEANGPHKVPEGKPSEDTIFITNLDYKVNFRVLNTLFKDLKPKWIYVPSRKVPSYVLKRQKARGKPIFNKGIAFVKFANEESQKKAVEEFNGKELNGRNIIVDYAIDARIPKEEEVKGNSEAQEAQEAQETEEAEEVQAIETEN